MHGGQWSALGLCGARRDRDQFYTFLSYNTEEVGAVILHIQRQASVGKAPVELVRPSTKHTWHYELLSFILTRFSQPWIKSIGENLYLPKENRRFSLALPPEHITTGPYLL